MFELANRDFTDPLESEIRTLLSNFEPRIIVRAVNVGLFPDYNELDVSIIYDIVGLPTTRQKVNFILQPTRY